MVDMSDTEKRYDLERVTRKLTAFDSFAELCSACETGYVPTLPTRKNGAAQPEALMLVSTLHAIGLRTWQPESGR